MQYSFRMLPYKFLPLFLILIIGSITAEPRRTPARVLAKQTGATQFEEERYEKHVDCNDSKHHLKKRASDEDVDYEVYQGVVGRPGIDFPIYPRIPRTSFSCKSYGNGYFADMDTDCQVFHICEDGRKISFLCPNGTIFQQSELTCDWWFKVNCLGSSGYYAESSEILNKQRVQRIRPAVPVQGFNIVGGGLDIKPKVPNNTQHRSKQTGRIPERRIDSSETPSVENVDFDDVSGEKQLKIPQNKIVNNIDNNNNDETQITAESGSLVEAGRYQNSISRDAAEKRKDNYGHTPTPSKPNYTSQRSYTSESTEQARLGHRGQQRYRDESRKSSYNTDKNISEESREHKTVALPDKIVKPIVASDEYPKQYSKSTQSSTPSTTKAYSSGTYSTARKMNSTRSTPYYTPTIPPVNNQKSNKGKINYVKSNGVSSATTPNPNRLPGGTAKDTVINYTVKPIVLGLRHYTEKPQSEEYYTPTTTAASTGPTYLPRNSNPPSTEKSAAGESLLFAPSAGTDDSVTRNLDEMLKVMNTIQHKFNDDNRSFQRNKPSEALVTLTQYYAGESPNSLYGTGGQSSLKPTYTNSYAYKPITVAVEAKPAEKASEATTANNTSAAEVSISIKSDDIKAGLLSEKTVAKYTDLFGVEQVTTNKPTIITTKFGGENAGKFPNIGSTDATISQLAEKPESRNIAQVFSNALTTYLKDPTGFREELNSIRPTEPPSTKENYVTLKPTDSPTFNHGTAASYLPTVPTPRVDISTTQSSIAAEINNKFDTATSNYIDNASTLYPLDTSTNKDSLESIEQKTNKLELSAEFYPPTNESEESGEILKKEQTNSFVTPKNKELQNKPQVINTTTTTTEKSWKVSEHDFLDPLTINDGLMKSTKSTTSSPITYISIATTNRPGVIRKENYQTQPRINDSNDSWQEIFNRYEIPAETLPSNSGLQRIANKLFGGLNETEALHLKNVMQQAEHNRQVLSLLLLLIQTCDDQNGRALERSRKHLLNALIDMDTKFHNENAGKSSYVHQNTYDTTTENIPSTTYSVIAMDNKLQQMTTTTTTEGVTSTPSSLEETTKFEIRVEDPEDDYSTSGSETATTKATTADKRALELLKSLYSLASKFTSRR